VLQHAGENPKGTKEELSTRDAERAEAAAPTTEPSVSIDLIWPPVLLIGCHTSITCNLRANLAWLGLYTNLQTVNTSREPLHMNAIGTCEGRTVGTQSVALNFIRQDTEACEEAGEYALRWGKRKCISGLWQSGHWQIFMG
jgi:hypothetical protein